MNEFIEHIILRYRRSLIVLTQILLIPLSYFSAFLLRFDFYIDREMFLEPFIKTLPLLICCRLLFFYYVDLFSGWWSYVGIEDIIKIVNAVLFSSLLFITSVVFIFGLHQFPRSVFIIDTLLIILFLCTIRIVARLTREKFFQKRSKTAPTNVLIMGAGNTGLTVLHEIRSNPELNLRPVGFIDDDPQKRGFRIKNAEVLGTHNDIPDLVVRYNVEQVFIAVPSAPYKNLQKIVEVCEQSNVKYQSLPGFSKLITGKTFVSQMRDVDPDELLGRPAVTFENERTVLQKEIINKSILITGAGGSIGSELCRQIASLRPKNLILYERSENNLFYIDLEIRRKFPDINIVSIIGDILNKDKFNNTLVTYNPSIVYHAAAYKHVTLMEKDPTEALRNNFLGTKIISEICANNNIEKFVFISTDKAVNPSSIMGTTKRMTEKILQSYNSKPTKFVSVRFGNVIGSSGSVIPLFKRQIAEGGPVTVTHPDATRFLMTIPEAVHLVLIAGAMGNGGEVFLLDMGEPANIAELAKSLIELSGLTPHKDISIEYIGLREGEKLHEELYWEGENISTTAHKKIRKLARSQINTLNYTIQAARMEKMLQKGDYELTSIYELMQSMVPEAAFHKINAPLAESAESARRTLSPHVTVSRE